MQPTSPAAMSGGWPSRAALDAACEQPLTARGRRPHARDRDRQAETDRVRGGSLEPGPVSPDAKKVFLSELLRGAAHPACLKTAT